MYGHKLIFLLLFSWILVFWALGHLIILLVIIFHKKFLRLNLIYFVPVHHLLFFPNFTCRTTSFRKHMQQNFHWSWFYYKIHCLFSLGQAFCPILDLLVLCSLEYFFWRWKDKWTRHFLETKCLRLQGFQVKFQQWFLV